jgi:Fe-S-cluster-containing dehydrogenase component
MPAQMGGVNRRDFLSLMAASLALAGVEGCTPAASLPEKIVPYVQAPEQLLPGIPLHFATAMPFGGYGIGLIARSEEGRPVKVEGNPHHPASLGSTDIFAQASVLNLYDPDRAKSITSGGAISTLDPFVSVLSERLEAVRPKGGSGLRFLSGRITSPSENDLMNRILHEFPNAVWHQYEPVNDDNARAGAKLAFGRVVDTIYNFDRADVIVSLDSDFLSWGPAHIRQIQQFAARRAVQPGAAGMNRLYVFESAPTIAGMKADHRAALRPADITRLAVALASRLGVSGSGNQELNEQWFDPLMRDLQSHTGSTLVIAGETQPPFVHALIHAINEKLGNAGRTVEYREPINSDPVILTDSLRELTQAMQSGEVDTLVLMDVNPSYAAPVDLEFSKHLKSVKLKISHSLYYDETAAECDWHVPKHHFLESWGDVRAYDGSVSIIQPLIVPLYRTRSTHEFLSTFLGNPTRSNYDLVREFWTGQYKGKDFESFWEQSVREGIVPNSATVPLAGLKAQPLPSGTIPPAGTPSAPDNLDVMFRPDPSLYDGSLANNAWLLELPQQMTHLTWDNAVLISPKTSRDLQAYDDDLVDLIVNGKQITGAIFVNAGQANNTAAVHLGWGRTRAGQNGTERGFNAYMLRTSSAQWLATGGRIRKHGKKYQLVSTREHHATEGRHMVRHTTVDDYAKNPGLVQQATLVPRPDETMYPEFVNVDNEWGMSVDLSRCVGCNACVIACQAENNIPTVGKDETARGREMHWMRIDTYFEGPAENPDGYFQPMFCQHCEKAPCEYVCPVAATTHSAEGINEMTYNRCIGTRYCSNNCPYKVRRFNFFEYAIWDVPSLNLLYNPDVTVRSRGVMEKCTYCIQRINRTRIDALKADRKIQDGEVMTACQQSCPANALVFGNLLDLKSKVSRLKSEPRDYSVLSEYNTRPRTTYLASLKNPNPEIAGLQTAEHSNG